MWRVAQSWLDLLFLSFSLQSATGSSDLMPLTPLARTDCDVTDVLWGDVFRL